MIDFEEVVFSGNVDKYACDDLSSYYVRQFKKAENEHYTPFSFFRACYRVLRRYDVEIEKQLSEDIEYFRDKQNQSPSKAHGYYESQIEQLKNKKYTVETTFKHGNGFLIYYKALGFHLKTELFTALLGISPLAYVDIIGRYSHEDFPKSIIDVYNEIKDDILDEFHQSLKTNHELIKAKEQQDQSKIKNNTEPLFVNNFDKVEVKKVYSYFKTELVDKNILDEKTLLDYLIAAFQNQMPNKNKFDFKTDIQIGKITTIFFSYYKKIAFKPHGKKQEYAKLLGEYFNGFETEKVMNNFRD